MALDSGVGFATYHLDRTGQPSYLSANGNILPCYRPAVGRHPEISPLFIRQRVGVLASRIRRLTLGSAGGIAGMCACASGRPSQSCTEAVIAPWQWVAIRALSHSFSFLPIKTPCRMPSHTVVNAPCCSALVSGSRETIWIAPDGHCIRVPATLFSFSVGGPDGLSLVFHCACRTL